MTDPAAPHFPYRSQSTSSPLKDPSLSPDDCNSTSVGAPQLSAEQPRPTHSTFSCVTCRRRKVKCNKQFPCSNCAKAGTTCAYPLPERATRRSRKPRRNDDLVARIKKLEGLVDELNGSQTGEQHRAGGPKAEGEHGKETSTTDSTRLEQAFGRLLVDEGKSRYVASSVWAGLSEQVEDIKAILNEGSDDEIPAAIESGASPSSQNLSGFIFGYSSLAIDMHELHPPLDKIMLLWQIFKDNVETLIKAVHVPTMERFFMDLKDDLSGLSKSMEPLMFVIYFAAVTSLAPDECREILGEDRDALMSQYRFATEQALSRAGFLSTQELVVLQALVIFLICVRRSDESRFVWTLSGLAIRIAQALGLHRDGTCFNLPPFETEMRRRVWWSICVLDLRSAEDHGFEPMLAESSYDTKFPLNINDSDIEPDSVEFPEPREGFTEMTLCILRNNINTTVRRIVTSRLPQPGTVSDEEMLALLKEKERTVEDFENIVEEKFVPCCDRSKPLSFLVASISRLVAAKMRLRVYHPFLKPGSGVELSQQTKDRLFLASVEGFEFVRALESDSITAKWSWLTRTFAAWDSLAHLLTELCVRTKGELVDRAWEAVRWVFDTWGQFDRGTTKKMLWGPLQRLREKAERIREADQARERAMTTGQPDSSSSSGPPAMDAADDGMFTRIGPTGAEPIDPLASSSSMPVSTPVLGSVLSSLEPQPLAFHQPSSTQQPQEEPWVSNDQLPLNPAGNDDIIDWAAWEDMLRSYKMEIDHVNSEQRGPVLDELRSWW